MKLLAIDTAMAACSAAVIDTSHELPLAALWLAMERGHAEALAPMVRQVMAEARLQFSGLDRIVVTTGPGTFTGVRIGLAMARGFGLALNLPVVGIDTLSAIAANVTAEGVHVLVTSDARKGEVYAALFDGTGMLARKPAVVAVASAADVPEGTIVLGTAADAAIAASGRSDLTRSQAGDLPVAAHFALAAAAMPSPQSMPSPLYLRAPDAKPQAVPWRRPSVIAFRLAAPLEASMLAGLYGECFDKPWSATEFMQLMAMPGALTIMAMEGGEPVAFALLRQAAGEAEIITIATRPFARNRGIAKALLNHQITELQAHGVTTAFLEVAESNTAARVLYVSCGFRQVGIRRGYYERRHGVREDAIVMRKELAR